MKSCNMQRGIMCAGILSTEGADTQRIIYDTTILYAKYAIVGESLGRDGGELPSEWESNGATVQKRTRGKGAGA